jgi:hypothetical protein
MEKEKEIRRNTNSKGNVHALKPSFRILAAHGKFMRLGWNDGRSGDRESVEGSEKPLLRLLFRVDYVFCWTVDKILLAVPSLRGTTTDVARASATFLGWPIRLWVIRQNSSPLSDEWSSGTTYLATYAGWLARLSLCPYFGSYPYASSSSSCLHQPGWTVGSSQPLGATNENIPTERVTSDNLEAHERAPRREYEGSMSRVEEPYSKQASLGILTYACHKRIPNTRSMD